MTVVYQPDIFLVGGMPQNGKSQFAINYCKYNANSVVIHADDIFQLISTNIIDIFLYVNSESFDIYGYIDLLKYEIEKIQRSQTYTKTILIEGYVCEKYKDQITKMVTSMGFNYVYSIVMQKTTDTTYLCMFDGTIVGLTDSYNYYNLFKNIEELLKEKTNVVNRTTYQRFPWISETQINSNSDIKFNISFKDETLFDKTFLDIGCNSGLFGFKAKQLGAKYVYGIDNNPVWLDLGYAVNKYFYNFGGVQFINANILDYTMNVKVDYIFCASVFHYFKERQEEFIQKVHDLLTDNGVLFIEVELYPDDSSYDGYVKRGNDDNPLRYPSSNGFMQMIHNKFKLESKQISYKQPGCLYDRYMYKLRKQ